MKILERQNLVEALALISNSRKNHKEPISQNICNLTRHLTEYIDGIKSLTNILDLMAMLPKEAIVGHLVSLDAYSAEIRAYIYPNWTIKCNINTGTTRGSMSYHFAENYSIMLAHTFLSQQTFIEYIVKSQSTKDNKIKRRMRKQFSDDLVFRLASNNRNTSKNRMKPNTFIENKLNTLNDISRQWLDNVDQPLVTNYILPFFGE